MKRLAALLFIITGTTFIARAQFKPSALDKSPMDMCYYPVNYPVLKVQNKVTEPLLARIVYSRPQKNGRQVFGELVEFGQVWRLGANEATEIEVYKDCKVNGQKLKKGEVLASGKKVKIKKDGELWFKYRRWGIYLKEGIYDPDSVVAAQKQRREYIIDDSVYTVLKSRGLDNCEMKGLRCGNPYAFGRRSPHDDTITTTSADSVVLTWEREADYAGGYLVVFSNLFDEYVGMASTDTNELILNLIPYRKEKAWTIVGSDFRSRPGTNRIAKHNDFLFGIFFF